MHSHHPILAVTQGGLGMQRFSWIAGQMTCIRSHHLTRQFVDEQLADVEGFRTAMNRWTTMSIGDTPNIPDMPSQGYPLDDLRNHAEAAYLVNAAAIQRRLVQDNFPAHAAWFLSSQFGGSGSGCWISPSVGVQCLPHLSRRERNIEKLSSPGHSDPQ